MPEEDAVKEIAGIEDENMNFIKNRMEYRRLCLRPCGFI